ncbi:TolB family protein [Tautonia rosea]|uniref:TolB family protein n=1 Tax=Tautonia rosea TaxID=2728037 RepID=UPI0014759659|nr:PD40 domain-containing protein [Tautonia rosea]
MLASLGLLVALAGMLGAEETIARHTEDGRDVIRPIWSPDGTELAFARADQGGSAIWQYVMPMNPPGPPRRLTERTDPEYQGVFAPNGRRMLLTIVPRSGTQGNCDLALLDRETGELTVVVDDRGGRLSHQEWPTWAPDGERFAFSSTHEGNQEIYTSALSDSDLVRLTQSPGIDSHPAWSPRGDRIVFATDRWGNLELASIRPDGTDLTRLTDSPGLDDDPSVSPDGRHVAFVSNRDRRFAIYVLDLDHPDAPPLRVSQHSGRETMPTWTPDGRGVTFVSDRDGGMDVYTVDVSIIVDDGEG